VRFLRHQGLTIFFGVVFLLALGGQAISGYDSYNHDQRNLAALAHQQPKTISLGRYLTSSEFTGDVAENWQSEYLQFFLYIAMTVWLVQRGSPESKPPDKAGLESDEDQKVGEHADRDSPLLARIGGLPTKLYENSLLLLMGLVFLGSWFAQSVGGWSSYNHNQSDYMQPSVSWFTYIGSSDFWNRTLQNWQSEFLAVGSMVIFAVYLRQRGSPESKPVGSPHDATGVEG